MSYTNIKVLITLTVTVGPAILGRIVVAKKGLYNPSRFIQSAKLETELEYKQPTVF